MKGWQPHLGWAMVTAAAVAITWRAASPTPPAPVPPGPVAIRSAPADPGREAGPAAPSPDLVPISAVIAAQAVPKPAASTLVEKIRDMIRNSDNYNDFNEVMKGMTDRAVKLALAKEALAGKNKTAAYWFMNELQQMKGRDVAELLEDFLQAHPDSEDGAIVAGILGYIGDPGSLAPLQDAFHSTSEALQQAAALSLRQLGFPGPSAQLMTVLTRQFENPDGALRRKAVERMAELDPAAAVPVIMRALQDSNGDVRIAAINALEAVPQLDSALLIEPLLHDPNPDVARTVKNLLEALKTSEK